MTLAIICATLLAGAQPAAVPAELPFLESAPEVLLASATTATEGYATDIVVIGEEGFYSFDDEGRRTLRYRLTYRILTQAGLDSWKSLSAVWSPWHEERPILRARVVRKDGSVYALDPQTIAETPVESSEELLSDQRRLLAPLPGIAIGAVVERETVVRGHGTPVRRWEHLQLLLRSGEGGARHPNPPRHRYPRIPPPSLRDAEAGAPPDEDARVGTGSPDLRDRSPRG